MVQAAHLSQSSVNMMLRFRKPYVFLTSLALVLSICAQAVHSQETNQESSLIEKSNGAEELEKLLEDRPALAPLLDLNPEIREWIVKKFTGNSFGIPFLWNNSIDGHDSGASHGFILRNGERFVQILTTW